jgi:hypothetical protein
MSLLTEFINFLYTHKVEVGPDGKTYHSWSATAPAIWTLVIGCVALFGALSWGAYERHTRILKDVREEATRQQASAVERVEGQLRTTQAQLQEAILRATEIPGSRGKTDPVELVRCESQLRELRESRQSLAGELAAARADRRSDCPKESRVSPSSDLPTKALSRPGILTKETAIVRRNERATFDDGSSASVVTFWAHGAARLKVRAVDGKEAETESSLEVSRDASSVCHIEYVGMQPDPTAPKNAQANRFTIQHVCVTTRK